MLDARMLGPPADERRTAQKLGEVGAGVGWGVTNGRRTLGQQRVEDGTMATKPDQTRPDRAGQIRSTSSWIRLRDRKRRLRQRQEVPERLQ